MGVVVAFDYNAWSVRYPEFGSISESLAAAYFAEAGLYLRNDGGGPVSDAATQSLLLNMLTAHIAALNYGVNGEPSSPLVGRIASATEGSVSVSVDTGALPGSAAWFQQTKYGLSYWQATAGYRTMRYVPSCSYSAPLSGYGAYGGFSGSFRG